ncbi:MAG: adenine phosphoribosyltransferase [Proteobacteria bacterium]|nr:adenine phosphoribosyltransferase [Pseudomonadota bacterium]
MSEWATSRIRTIPDFPRKGVQFRDITTLLADPVGFRKAVDELVQLFAGVNIDKIAGIESRGFILGGAVAHQLSTGFIPLRKPGKLPYTTIGQDYQMEYGAGRLEMHIDAIKEGDFILLVDDLIATGGTAEAAVKLIQSVGAKILAACFVIDLPDLGGSQKLKDMGLEVVTLCEFKDD